MLSQTRLFSPEDDTFSAFLNPSASNLCQHHENSSDGSIADLPFAENIAMVQAEVAHNPLALKNAPEEMRDLSSIVMKAVKKNGLAIQFASPRLKRDFFTALVAVKQNGSALKFVDPTVEGYKDIVKMTLDLNPRLLIWEEVTNILSPIALEDKQIVLRAVKQNGFVLEHISDAVLLQNKEIILSAVKQNGLALEYVEDQSMKLDREVVLAAVAQNGLALEFVSEVFVNDREVVLTALNQCGESLRHCSEELRSNFDIVFAAVKKYGISLQFASSELQSDFQIVSAAVNSTGQALQFASRELQDNSQVVIAAVSNDCASIRFASESLKDSGLYEAVCEQIAKYSITPQVLVSTFLFGCSPSYGAKFIGREVNSQNPEELKYSKKEELASPLQLLTKLGPYAGLEVKQKIAGYLGLRVGDKWESINRVAWYLEFIDSNISSVSNGGSSY